MTKPKTEPRDTNEIIDAEGSIHFFAGYLRSTIRNAGVIKVDDWNAAVEATLEEAKRQAEKVAGQ